MVSSLLAILTYKYLAKQVNRSMWEEYFLPGLFISFTLGALLGINAAILCIPRFFEPMSSSHPQTFAMKHPVMPPAQNPMRYPSGYTAKQLQQHDFTQRRAIGHGQPIGANARRPLGGGAFNY